MKNSNRSSGIKREDNWASLVFLDFLLLLTLIMFPGGPQEECFKEEVRKEKQVRKWNICLSCWLRHSWAKDLKCSLCSHRPAKNVEPALILIPVFSFSCWFYTTVTKLQCVGEKQRKKEQERKNRIVKHSTLPPPLSVSFQISNGWEQDHWCSDGGRVHTIRLTPSASLQLWNSWQAVHPTVFGRAHCIDFSCKDFLYIWSVAAPVVTCAFMASLDILFLELRVNSALLFIVLFFFSNLSWICWFVVQIL